MYKLLTTIKQTKHSQVVPPGGAIPTTPSLTTPPNKPKALNSVGGAGVIPKTPSLLPKTPSLTPKTPALTPKTPSLGASNKTPATAKHSSLPQQVRGEACHDG